MAAPEQPSPSTSAVVEILSGLGFTHVIWLPDSTLGLWERILAGPGPWRLIRVCREGEAWPLAAGLWVGGQLPWVWMQSTGLFESGDALRNVVFDLGLPMLGLIGARGYTMPGSSDSARGFLEPILRAWGIEYRLVERLAPAAPLVDWYRQCLDQGKAGMVLLAEP